MIFELTDDIIQHNIEIVAGEMYLLVDNPELLKMNEEYREEYGIDLFKKKIGEKPKNTVKK